MAQRAAVLAIFWNDPKMIEETNQILIEGVFAKCQPTVISAWSTNARKTANFGHVLLRSAPAILLRDFRDSGLVDLMTNCF